MPVNCNLAVTMAERPPILLVLFIFVVNLTIAPDIPHAIKGVKTAVVRFARLRVAVPFPLGMVRCHTLSLAFIRCVDTTTVSIVSRVVVDRVHGSSLRVEWIDQGPKSGVLESNWNRRHMQSWVVDSLVQM